MTTIPRVDLVLRLYCSLPHTPARSRPNDRKLARRWLDDGLTVEQLHAALLLGISRRLRRAHHLDPLPPIRSLAYFDPILQEIRTRPLDHDYVLYLHDLCRRTTQTR